jgi:hypothetical protein
MGSDRVAASLQLASIQQGQKAVKGWRRGTGYRADKPWPI